MNRKKIIFPACLLCLVFIISVPYAQRIVPVEQPARVIRLYQENLPPQVDLESYVRTGEVKFLEGQDILPPKITPGPAPDPYPHVHVWDKGIEQLGESAGECDGIWFINANLWRPSKYALVMWNIRIPASAGRLAGEFEKDLTVSLWVDWNQDRTWGKNERVMNESLNLHEYFPHLGPFLAVSYLSMFRIPETIVAEVMSKGAVIYEMKIWARGVLSYDDPDVSPDGQCLFGEVEDYLINYFEIEYDQIKK